MAIRMSSMKPDISKIEESPDKRSGDSDMDGVIVHINNYLHNLETPTPVGGAIELKRVLAEIGMASDDEEIFYNFDDQYKVKFTENGRSQVAVFWAPWQGGVSWRIEDDK